MSIARLSDIAAHEHDHAYVCVVISGSYREHSDLGTRDCRAGDVLIHPAGALHSVVSVPSSRGC